MTNVNSLKARVLKLVNSGRFPEALVAAAELCTRAPQDTDAWYLRGAVHHQLGQMREAISAFRQAVAINSKHVRALAHLGAILEMNGDLAGAENCNRTILGIDPNNALVRRNLGNVLRKRGRDAEAVEHLRVAAQLSPNEAQVHYALGVALHRLGDREAAIAAYGRALALDPGLTGAHTEMGSALREMGRYSAAIRCFEIALKLNPRQAIAANNLGSALLHQARRDEGRVYFRRAMEVAPAWAVAHSNLLLSLNYDVTDGTMLVEAHRAFARIHGHTDLAPVFTNVRDRQRRLRVGYVSPDFREHSVAWFAITPLVHHNRAAFEIYCYANVERPDVVTERMKKLMGATWRDIRNVADTDAARLIRDDGIDILVDLAGHTANGRLTLFAQRPAPVQVSWLGYPNTTGMEVMEYRLTDAWADPPGLTETWHTECLVRLPRGFLCYAPQPRAPAVAPPPSLANGFITFGSFNNFAKVTQAVVETWAAILNAAPDARLMLKSAALGDDETRDHLWAQFEAFGIAHSRIVLHDRRPKTEDHLRLYADVDIALDTFPYNGTTTTCEALWMGVPVVTLAGALHAGRVGVSLLNQVGLPELIAENPTDYVQRAVTLAADRERLAQYRQTLRERMHASPLCDSKAFTRDLEAAYREMWTQWCGGKP